MARKLVEAKNQDRLYADSFIEYFNIDRSCTKIDRRTTTSGWYPVGPNELKLIIYGEKLRRLDESVYDEVCNYGDSGTYKNDPNITCYLETTCIDGLCRDIGNFAFIFKRYTGELIPDELKKFIEDNINDIEKSYPYDLKTVMDKCPITLRKLFKNIIEKI